MKTSVTLIYLLLTLLPAAAQAENTKTPLILNFDEGLLWIPNPTLKLPAKNKKGDLKKMLSELGATENFTLIDTGYPNEGSSAEVSLIKGTVEELSLVKNKNKGDCFNYPDSYLDFKYKLKASTKNILYGVAIFSDAVELVAKDSLPEKVTSIIRKQNKDFTPRFIVHDKKSKKYLIFDTVPDIEPLGLKVSSFDVASSSYSYLGQFEHTTCGH